MTANALRILHEVSFTYEGREFTFSHYVDDIIKKAHAKGKFYELDLLVQLRKLLQQIPEDEIVLDVGAHVGNHTVFFSEVCQRCVMAFEPNPAIYDLLEKNIADNLSAGWMEPVPEAVGDGRSGKMHWASGLVNSGHVIFLPGEGEDVVCHSLDFLAEGPLKSGSSTVCLIKLDIEGGEEIALQHGQKFLAKHQPIVVVEDKLSRDKKLWPARKKRWFELLPHYRYEGRYASTPTHIFLPRRVGG